MHVGLSSMHGYKDVAMVPSSRQYKVMYPSRPLPVRVRLGDSKITLLQRLEHFQKSGSTRFVEHIRALGGALYCCLSHLNVEISHPITHKDRYQALLSTDYA